MYKRQEETALKKETDRLSQERLADLQKELAELRDEFNTKKVQWENEKKSVGVLRLQDHTMVVLNRVLGNMTMDLVGVF